MVCCAAWCLLGREPLSRGQKAMTNPRLLLLLLPAWAACNSSTSGKVTDSAADIPGTDAGGVDLSLQDATPNDLASERQGGDTSADRNTEPFDTAVVMDAPPVDTAPPAGCGAVGSPCAAEGESCSTGDSVEIACRELRVCQGGRWRSVQTFLAVCQSGGNACPMNVPNTGSTCTLHFQLCAYTTGTSCGCVSGCESGVDAGPCAKPLAWACSSANGAPSSLCPPRAPQLGAPCGSSTIQCTYGPYCSAYVVQCKDYRWQLPPFSTVGGCG
jgi:hypothetical protein